MFGGFHNTAQLGSLNPSGIVTGGLIGDFDTNTGNLSGTARWSNSISGEPDLEIKNGTIWITGTNDASSVFKFDGVDNYIGSYNDVYNESFNVNLYSGFSICTWWSMSGNTGEFTAAGGGSYVEYAPLVSAGDVVKESGFWMGSLAHLSGHYMGSDLDYGKGHIMLEAYEDDDEQNYPWSIITNQQGIRRAGRPENGFNDRYTLTSGDNEWHMISCTVSSGGRGSGQWNIYIDSSSEPTIYDNSPYRTLQNADSMAAALWLGRVDKYPSYDGDDYPFIGGTHYAGQNFRLGRVLVYSKELKESEIRQNYYATKDDFLKTGDYEHLVSSDGGGGG
jgi:hypothetical protein